MKDIKRKVHDIIFEADTKAGKAFDVLLLIFIVISITVVMLESVKDIYAKYGDVIEVLEWSLTIVFTIEYILRIYSVDKPLKYIFSFFGLIDLLSLIPTYIGFFGFRGVSFVVIRALRLLRVFRIFKLGRYLGEANQLKQAMAASKAKIIVFIGAVMTIVTILGTIMYMVETPESGFTSIPRSIYWAIVTLTTVGYGDIAPATVLGQMIASMIMILGYGIIAVPTGIVTNELSNSKNDIVSTQSCSACAKDGHDHDAVHCKYCGEIL